MRLVKRWRRTMFIVLSVIALVAADFLFILSSTKACCNSYAEYAAACRAEGGRPSGPPPRCDTGSGGSGSGSGGLDLGQQMMLGFSQALVTAIAESMRKAEELREQEHLKAREEAAAQMVLFKAKEEQRIKDLQDRIQKLLGSLKGTHGTELGLKRTDSSVLERKTGSALFGIPSDATVSVPVPGTPGHSLELVQVPCSKEEMQAKKCLTSTPAKMDEVWRDYYRAADKQAEAEINYEKLKHEKEAIEKVRKEAKEKFHEQQARAAQSFPDKRKEEDDKLAQAQKLLEEATQLDDKATKKLDQAKQDAETAKQEVERLEKERAKAEKSLAQTGKP